MATQGRLARVSRRLLPALVALPIVAGGAYALAREVGAGPEPALLVIALVGFLALLAVVMDAARALRLAEHGQATVLAATAGERDLAVGVLHSLEAGVVVLEPGGRVIDVNPSWCAVTGRPAPDLIGSRPPYPWQPEGPVPAPADEPPRGNNGWRWERGWVRRPDGGMVPVLSTRAPVPDRAGGTRAIVATYLDISGWVRSDERQGAHAARLAEANERLRMANRQMADASGFKTDLVEMVSHEMSQPLSSMASLAELLVADWAQLDEDTRYDLATKIDKNTTRLARMIMDLTLAFRLDAGTVTTHRVPAPIAPLIETAPIPEDLPARIDVPADLLALVDRGHLRQVIGNLVINAVEYGAGPIEIEAEGTPDGVRISVLDHGPGIPEELVPQLFHRFTRRGTVGRSGHKGAGLGLFIANGLLRINGCSIGYRPVVPHGALIEIRLEPATEQDEDGPTDR